MRAHPAVGRVAGRRRVVTGVAVAALLLGACGGGEPGPGPAAEPGAGATAGPDGATNPVVDDDFPDPDLLRVGDVTYAHATEGNRADVRAARSTDPVAWETLLDVRPGRHAELSAAAMSASMRSALTATPAE